MEVDSSHQHQQQRDDAHGMTTGGSSLSSMKSNKSVTPSSTASTPRSRLNTSMSSSSSSAKRRKSRKSPPHSSPFEGGGDGSMNYPPVYSQHRQPGPNSNMPPHYTHSYNPHMPGAGGPGGPGGPGGGYGPPPGPMWSGAGGHGQPNYGGQWSRPKHVGIFREQSGGMSSSSRSPYPRGEPGPSPPGGWYGGGGGGGASHLNGKLSSSSSSKNMDPHMKGDTPSPGRTRSESPHKRQPHHPSNHPPPSQQHWGQNSSHHWPSSNHPHRSHWQSGSGGGHMMMPHQDNSRNGTKPMMSGNGLPQHLMSGGHPGGSPSGTSLSPMSANNNGPMAMGPNSKMWNDRRRDGRHPMYPGRSSPDPLSGKYCKEIGIGMEDDERRKKERDDEKGRGSYRCGRCGVPKKGHVCPYQPKLKRRPDEPPPVMKTAATQVELDEYMVLRRLNLEIQGFPESYATEASDPLVGVATEAASPQHLNPHPQHHALNESPHRSPHNAHHPSPHHSTHGTHTHSPHHLSSSPHPNRSHGRPRNHDPTIAGMMGSDIRALPPVSATISTSTGMGMDSGGSASSRQENLGMDKY